MINLLDYTLIAKINKTKTTEINLAIHKETLVNQNSRQKHVIVAVVEDGKHRGRSRVGELGG